MVCFAERQTEFIGLVMSPWSQKARWALTYSQVNYVYTEKGMLEWPLRLRLGISSSGEGADSDGKLTFPILVKKDGSQLRQTLSIVKWSQTEAPHAVHIGGKKENEWNEAIEEWDGKGVQLMRYGRYMSFLYAEQDDAAQIEVVKILGLPLPGDGLKLTMGRAVSSTMKAKYEEESNTTSLEQTKQILDELLALLKKQPSWQALSTTGKLQGDGPYILEGCFTYADICMVLGLHCIRPFSAFPLGMLKPIFGALTKDLATEYEPLFVWGGAILDAHLPAELRDLVA